MRSTILELAKMIFSAVLGEIASRYAEGALALVLWSLAGLLLLWAAINLGKKVKAMTKVGSRSVVYGQVHPDIQVGDNSVVIGATDDRGNTIIRGAPGGLAIGAGANAGPASISIGYMAGARTGKRSAE